MTNGPRFVIYTAIFGKKDSLHEPRVRPEGVRFICFTDQDLTSSTWEVRKITPPVPGDPTRSARKVKILAHEYLPDAEVSIWLDGNALLLKDPTPLIERCLDGYNIALLDCAYRKAYPLHSLKEELDELIAVELSGKHQEDADLLKRQWAAYHDTGFPDTNGMAWTMFIIRRHMKDDVVSAMNAWWGEIVEWSKRDQMSFNYIAWKTGLRFNYIPLDGAENEYFRRLNHYLPFGKKLLSYLIGAQKRITRLFHLS